MLQSEYGCPSGESKSLVVLHPCLVLSIASEDSNESDGMEVGGTTRLLL
jgi:hypothetical protein